LTTKAHHRPRFPERRKNTIASARIADDFARTPVLYRRGALAGEPSAHHELLAKNESVAAALEVADPVVTISTEDVYPKTYGDQGAFYWVIHWKTNAKSGWIVQRVDTKINITDCKDYALKPYGPAVRTYWEAWPIVGGKVQDGTEPGTDGWAHENIGKSLLQKRRDTNHKGTWRIQGTVYYVPTMDPEKEGWSKTDDSPASGSLWSRWDDPGIKTSAKLTRKAGGDYTCCGDPMFWYHKPAK
jgi:hypothetical protein